MELKISLVVFLLFIFNHITASAIVVEQPRENKNGNSLLNPSLPKTDNSWLTVLDATVESGPKDAGFGCAELIESNLSQAGFDVVDRQAIRWLLEERNLQTEGYTTINKKSLAQLKHVDFWIQPIVQKTQTEELSIRLECIEVKTGLKIYSVYQKGIFPKHWPKVIESTCESLMEGLRNQLYLNINADVRNPISRIPEARLAYYTAMEHLNRQENQKFVLDLESALSIDAKFVVAAKWLSSFYLQKGFMEHATIIDKHFIKSKNEMGSPTNFIKTTVMLWTGDIDEGDRNWIETLFQKILNTKIMHLESISKGNRERDLELSGYIENYKAIYRQETRPDLVLMIGKDYTTEKNISMKLMDANSGRIIRKCSLKSDLLKNSEDLIRKEFSENQVNDNILDQENSEPTKQVSGDVFSNEATLKDLWFWSEKYHSGTSYIFEIRGAWCKEIMQRASYIKDKEIAGRWYAMALRSFDFSEVHSPSKYAKGTIKDGMKPSQMALKLRDQYPDCTSSLLLDYEIAHEMALEGQYTKSVEICERIRSNLFSWRIKGLQFTDAQLANIFYLSAYVFERAGNRVQSIKILSEVKDILSKNKINCDAEMIGRFEWLIDQNGRWYLTFGPGGQILSVQSIKAGKKSSLWKNNTTLGMEIKELESRLSQSLQEKKHIKTYDQMLEDALKVGFVEEGKKLHFECVEKLIDNSHEVQLPEHLWTQVAWMNLMLDKDNKELMAINIQLRSLVKTSNDRWHCMLATGDQEEMSKISTKEILSMNAKDAIAWLEIVSAWDWHKQKSHRVEPIAMELYMQPQVNKYYKTTIINALWVHRREETMEKLLWPDYQNGNQETRGWSAFWLGLAKNNSHNRFQSSEYFREAWSLCEGQKNDISENLQRLRHYAGYEFLWTNTQPTKILNERRWMFWIAAMKHSSTSDQFIKSNLQKYRSDDIPIIIQLMHNHFIRRRVGAKLSSPFINFNEIPSDLLHIFSSILYPDPIYNGVAGNAVLAILRNKEQARTLMPIFILTSSDPMRHLSGNSSWAIEQLGHIAIKRDLPTIVKLLNHSEQNVQNTSMKVLKTSAKHYGVQTPKEDMTISDWQQFIFPNN